MARSRRATGSPPSARAARPVEDAVDIWPRVSTRGRCWSGRGAFSRAAASAATSPVVTSQRVKPRTAAERRARRRLGEPGVAALPQPVAQGLEVELAHVDGIRGIGCGERPQLDERGQVVRSPR